MFLEAEIKRDLLFIESEKEQENYLTKALLMAEISDDKEKITALANVIVGEAEEENFSTSLRAKALRYVILHLVQALQSNADNEKLDKIAGDLYERLWELKWVAEDYAKTLDFSEEDIINHISFMGDMYELFEINVAPVYKSIMLISIDMGEQERAEGAFDRWIEEKNKDGADLNDCQACEVTEMVKYHEFIGEYEKAIELAEPILSGRLSCAEVPELTYVPVLKSMIALGEIEKAKVLLKEALSRINQHENKVEFLPQVIEVCYLLGEINIAERLSREIKKDILKKTDEFYQLQYYMSTFWQSEDHLEKAKSLSKAFDERNSNQYYQLKLNALCALN